MPIAPFLALNNRNGTPQLLRYVNCSPATVGVTFGTGDTQSAGLGVPRGYPAVVKFGGSQTFLATVGTGVYRSTDGGASWSQVVTFTTGGSGNNMEATRTSAKSGLWVLQPNGVATAVVLTSNGPANQMWAHYSTNGTSWTALGPFTTPGTVQQNDMFDAVVWRGKLCSLWGQADANTENCVLSVFDPVTNSMTFTSNGSMGGATQANGAMCVFNDRLFCLIRSYGGAAQTLLREFVGGTFVTQGTSMQSAGGSSTGKPCLFVDPATDNMVAWTSNSSAWAVFKWDSSLNRTDITSLCKPTGLAAGNDVRISAIIDDRTVPGSAPTIWLMTSVDGGVATAMNQWSWNGVGSFIGTLPGSASSAPQDSGGTARDNFPFIKHAQGTTYWTSGEDHIEMKGFSPIQGGLNVSFKLYSDTGTGTGSVRAWRGSATDEYPLSAATLTGTTTGLTKDNTTLYTVGWSAQTDGFSTGQYAKFILEKF